MSSPPAVHPRLLALLQSTTVNGLDYVDVAADHMTITVHFLNGVAVTGTPSVDGGDTIPNVPVDVVSWGSTAGRVVLVLNARYPGDFSRYVLSFSGPTNLDYYFSRVSFYFRPDCQSQLDCAVPPLECPPGSADVPPIDYLAKDFLSFKKALSDFSAARYPDWLERSEADFGVMLMEALCSVGDELSYYQDRVSAEAAISTATERRSITRLARLVDYQVRPSCSSTVLLQLDVSGSVVPLGLRVEAQEPDGGRIPFEIGLGLHDTTPPLVDPAWNRGNIKPWWWDDSERCLSRGSTGMTVVGHGLGLRTGQILLLDTRHPSGALQPVRDVVRLVSADEKPFDYVFSAGSAALPTPVTVLTWSADEPLANDHDLANTEIAGNLVWATQGERYLDTFGIPSNDPAVPSPKARLAATRTGPNSTPMFCYTLNQGPVTWLSQPGSSGLQPEIQLNQVLPSGRPIPWSASLLDVDPFSAAFTLESARFTTVGEAAGFLDYDGDAGDTIRFGDGTFGEIPGYADIFEITYRLGLGARGNVAADAITQVAPNQGTFVDRVTNPFAASNGLDPEPLETVRRLAPHAFRDVQYRAVRPEDFDRACRTLPWVYRAGTRYRWTGSWLTVFATADPKGGQPVGTLDTIDLVHLLNRYRLAGYEVYSPSPDYMAVDVRVTVCARSDSVTGDVMGAILRTLDPNRSAGFFFRDQFAFGTPLDRSRLEAAVQRAYGVLGVTKVEYRVRGVMSDFAPMPEEVNVGARRILRLENDVNRPEAGTLQIVVEGGR